MSDEIRTIFDESVEIFFDREGDNIRNTISEQNLCGRLAIYVTDKLKEYSKDEYFADTEYNRKQNGEVKTIIDDEMKVATIKSDLIVHTRGNLVENDNLITVEMKKSSRPDAEKLADRIRLKAMTKASYDGVWSANGIAHPMHVCGYKLGAYIIIDIKDRSYLVEYYKAGVQIDEATGNF